FINQNHIWRSYDAEEYNAAIAAFTGVPNVAAELRKYLSAKTETVTYDPGRESGRITVDGVQVINLFRPTDIRPAKGDAEPFLDFIRYLVPAEHDQYHLLKWIATLIARPDIRMTYGLLLWSIAQGVGKTTLAEQILTPLVGRYNCSFPTAQEAAEGTYTGWIAFKRLAVIAEIYEGHTAKTYNRLKTIITDDFVRVNERSNTTSKTLSTYSPLLIHRERSSSMSMIGVGWFLALPRADSQRNTSKSCGHGYRKMA